MLLLDEERAVQAIPALLARDRDQALRIGMELRKLIEIVGVRTATGKARLAEVEAMFAAIAGEPTANVDRLSGSIAADLRARPPRPPGGSKKTAA